MKMDPEVEKLKVRIKDMPPEERPRERLARLGGEALSTSELLAIILRTGSRGETALDVANKLLKIYNNSLIDLFSADVNELSKIRGVGFTKAVQLKAVFELYNRLNMFKDEEKIYINSPEDAYSILRPLGFLDKEHFVILSLNTRNRLVAKDKISVGSLNANIVDPKQIFKIALLRNAASIILAHNHPSGDPSPSDGDIEITKKIIEAGKLFDIEVQDHIIIGKDGFVSLREIGIL